MAPQRGRADGDRSDDQRIGKEERSVPRPDRLALRIDEIDIGLKQNAFVGEVAWFGFGHSSTVHETKQAGEEPACSTSGLVQGLVIAQGVFRRVNDTI